MKVKRKTRISYELHPHLIMEKLLLSQDCAEESSSSDGSSDTDQDEAADPFDDVLITLFGPTLGCPSTLEEDANGTKMEE